MGLGMAGPVRGRFSVFRLLRLSAYLIFLVQNSAVGHLVAATAADRSVLRDLFKTYLDLRTGKDCDSKSSDLRRDLFSAKNP